jgi:SAM-dependent methyltransferase
LRILLKYKDACWRRRVLEIGRGAGRTTELLHRLDVEYAGIDYSANTISHCTSRFPGANRLHVDARDTSVFGDEVFDFALFSNNGLDCLTHEDGLRALREVSRVLVRGGLLVFSSHNKQCRNAISHPGFQRFEDGYWILNDRAHLCSLLTYYTDLSTQAGQLRDLGFEPLEAFGLNGLELPLDGEDRESFRIYCVVRKS